MDLPNDPAPFSSGTEPIPGQANFTSDGPPPGDQPILPTDYKAPGDQVQPENTPPSPMINEQGAPQPEFAPNPSDVAALSNIPNPVTIVQDQFAPVTTVTQEGAMTTAVTTQLTTTTTEMGGVAPGTAPKTQYHYDITKVQYQEISVEQWKEIPVDHTEYSRYWADPEAFSPDKYAENSKELRKWNDPCCFVTFWLNFLIVFIMMIVAVASSPPIPSISGTSSYVVQSPATKVLDRAFLLSSSVEYWNRNSQELEPVLLEENPTFSPSASSSYDSDYDPTSIKSNRTLFLNSAFTDGVRDYSIGIGFAIGFVFSALHFVFIIFGARIYLQWGVFIFCLILVALFAVPALAIEGAIWIFVIPGLLLIVFIIAYCMCIRQHIPLSAAILKRVATLIITYPSAFLVVFGFIGAIIVGSLISMFMVLFSISNDFAAIGLCIYGAISFIWIVWTFTYAMYMAMSGIAASWYFLNGTEQFPEKPVWESFKRSVTTLFGSAAFASFLVVLQYILLTCTRAFYKAATSGAHWLVTCICTCAYCCCNCCLLLLSLFMKLITKYGLIYCAIFGIPFKEGCRRIGELTVKKFINLLLNSCIIEWGITMNQIVFALMAAALGVGIAAAIDIQSLMLVVMLPLFSVLWMVAIFQLVKIPIVVMGDTLMICFNESPDNLKTSAYELYEDLSVNYEKMLHKQIGKDYDPMDD